MIKQWKKQTGRFQSGERYVVGKIVVGHYNYASVSRGEPSAWDSHMALPGFGTPTTRHASEDEAKQRIERAFETWLKWLNDDTVGTSESN